MTRTRETTLEVMISPEGEGPRHGVLTVLSHHRPGMLIHLSDKPVTIGRGEEATIRFDDASLSRCHARFSKLRQTFVLEDLGSTNGSFVDGERIEAPTRLEDGIRVQLGGELVLRFSLQDEREYDAARKLYEATVRDALTGTFNRHYLDERLASEVSYANRHHTPLSLLFVDADHFKKINDTWGHPAGDMVLRLLAQHLSKSVRTEDIVARFGGEEFVIVARGIAGEGAMALAERLRAEVERLRIPYEDDMIHLTICIGVSWLLPEGPEIDPETLVAKADAALYQAKRGGRNRVLSA